MLLPPELRDDGGGRAEIRTLNAASATRLQRAVPPNGTSRPCFYWSARHDLNMHAFAQRSQRCGSAIPPRAGLAAQVGIEPTNPYGRMINSHVRLPNSATEQ